MKPYVHARLSARKYGGEPEDYLELHDFMDSTKAALPDVRHRAILHSAFGCFLVEKVFGTLLTTYAADADRALRAFKNDPGDENADAYREAKRRADTFAGKRTVSVRDVAEDHVREDIGRIPTVERWLRNLPFEPWMSGGVGAFKSESQPQQAD